LSLLITGSIIAVDSDDSMIGLDFTEFPVRKTGSKMFLYAVTSVNIC